MYIYIYIYIYTYTHITYLHSMRPFPCLRFRLRPVVQRVVWRAGALGASAVVARSVSVIDLCDG